jgi:two-component system sensor histidine kinase KdpD
METLSFSRWIEPPQRFRIVWQSAIAWAGIVLLAYIGFALDLGPVTISCFYLLVVLAVASFCGFWQASLTSLMAVSCLDYLFLPPIFHFNVTDSRDWAALGAFEATALVISRLSARELRSTREAILHRTGMEKLYELSRNLLLLDWREPPGGQLVALIHRIFGASAVAFFVKNLDSQDRIGDWAVGEQDIARECCLRDVAQDDGETQTWQRVLRHGSGSTGALVVRGKLSPLVVDALASLATIALDRHESFEKEEKADAARKSEELRAAVMDALAHEIKQPLTTAQAASSGLLELGGLTDLQLELVTMFDDEAVRLNELCTRMLMTAKLEPEAVGSVSEEVNLHDLISEVLAVRPAEDQRNTVKVSVDDTALSVCVNRGLLAMILTQYIENARKYSTPGTPIEIVAQKSHAEVLISVRNFGSTIRMEDRERIFDRFYRVPDSENCVSGTGIGLSVVKKAANAERGHVWVVSNEAEGTTFFLSLPTDPRRKP